MSSQSKLFSVSRPKALSYICASIFLNYSQNFSMNLFFVNIHDLQRQFGFTLLEMNWAHAFYMIPLVSLSFMLIKIRTQYGLRKFTQLSIMFFLTTCFFNIFVSGFYPLLLTRFLSGISAAPIASLSFLYMNRPFKEEYKYTVALSLHLTNTIIGVPFARLISPSLLMYGGYDHLYYFEIALAFSAFILIYFFPLIVIPQEKVIKRLDFVSYGVIAIGLGSNAIVMIMGQLAGWTNSSWIGYLVVVSIVCFMLAIMVELNRKSPLIDVRWLFSSELIELIISLLAFRILLSEQSSIVVSFFQIIGDQNNDSKSLFLIIILGYLLGGAICALWFRPGREDIFYIIALVLLFLGSSVGLHLTSHTQPQDFWLGQFIIALGGAMFLPPSMSRGLRLANQKGPLYTLSFIAVFLVTQNTGSLVSVAFFKALCAELTKYHYSQLLSLSHPPVLNGISITNFNGNMHHVFQSLDAAKKLSVKAGIMAYRNIFGIYTFLSILILFFFFIKLCLKHFRKENYWRFNH